jgi:hypothetical protein
VSRAAGRTWREWSECRDGACDGFEARIALERGEFRERADEEEERVARGESDGQVVQRRAAVAEFGPTKAQLQRVVGAAAGGVAFQSREVPVAPPR